MDRYSSILNFIARIKDRIVIKKIDELCIKSHLFNISGLSQFTVEDKFSINEIIELNICITNNIKNYSSSFLLEYLKSSNQILRELNGRFQKCQKCNHFDRCKELLYNELHPLIKSEEETINAIKTEKYFRKYAIIDDLLKSTCEKFNENLK